MWLSIESSANHSTANLPADRNQSIEVCEHGHMNQSESCIHPAE
jgi:hypothetical protein